MRERKGQLIERKERERERKKEEREKKASWGGDVGQRPGSRQRSPAGRPTAGG